MTAIYQINVYKSYADSVNAICSMVGHPPSNDPAGSEDPAVRQMGTALNLANQQLMAMEQWQPLIKEMTIKIETVAPDVYVKQQSYDLPPDFFAWIDQTQWNETTMLPAIGPVSPQAWMTYVVRTTFPQLSIYWQVRENKLHVLNPPPYGTPYMFRAMYMSQAIVLGEGSSPTDPIYKSLATQNGDDWVLDGMLVTLLGRVKYLAFKGFSTEAAQQDFQAAYETRVKKPDGAVVLNMTRAYGYPYLGYGNMPDVGFGSSP